MREDKGLQNGKDRNDAPFHTNVNAGKRKRRRRRRQGKRKRRKRGKNHLQERILGEAGKYANLMKDFVFLSYLL